MRAGRFRLGQVVATRGVLAEVPQEDQLASLLRHVLGDWGDVCREDALANERAVRDGERILSKYKTDSGVAYYLITEHDRSLTTLLLVDEY